MSDVLKIGVKDYWGEEICTVAKDTNDSGVEETKDKAYKMYMEKTYQVIALIGELKLPMPGEQLRLVTKRTFNTVAFLKYIAEREVVEHLNMVIYSINYEAARVIDELIKNKRILRCTILLSNLRNKAHRKKEQLTKDIFIDNPVVDLFFCSSHAKIMNFKTTDGNYYSVEGSGNLSYNSRVEQYVIDNDKGLYDFTCEWMADIRIFLTGKKELVDYGTIRN